MTVEEAQMGVGEEENEKKLKNFEDNNKEVDEEKQQQHEQEEEEEETRKPNVVEKSSSYKEESNFLSDLKDFERKALSEFKSALEKEQEEEEAETEKPKLSDTSLWGVPLLPTTTTKSSEEGTDVILLKFLRAREFKVAEALEMLRTTLRWRIETGVENVLGETDLGPANATWFSGSDRDGHPVCYNVFGVFSNDEAYRSAFGSQENRERFLRWRCQLMERSVKMLDFRPGGVSSLVHVNDLKNSPGPTRKELRIAAKEAIAMLQDNYPELVAKNIFINVPFWFYALNAVLSPFLTQRTKSKFVVARPGKVTETLLKYIPAEEIPEQYGGFKRENDTEFIGDECAVSELILKPGATETVEIPAPESGTHVVWDLVVLGWEVSYKEEFIPSDEGSYTIIVLKGKKLGASEGPVRNSFRCNEPGKVVLSITNNSGKKKRALYRYNAKKTSS